jgi:hypothetical protein
MACALAIAGNINVRPSASGRASAMSQKRRLDFEDKIEIDIVLQSLLKPVCLDVSVLIGDMFLSHYANGAWINNLFMLGASKNTTCVTCPMIAFSTPG